MATGRLVELRDDNFGREVLAAERPVLVEFHATWCRPCKTLAPVVEGLARELGQRVTVGKVDVDASPAIAARYGVRAVPTLILFRHGEPVTRLLGAVPRARIEAVLNPVLEEEGHAVSS